VPEAGGASGSRHGVARWSMACGRLAVCVKLVAGTTIRYILKIVFAHLLFHLPSPSRAEGAGP